MTVLSDLARVKAIFQQRAIIAVLNEGVPQMYPAGKCNGLSAPTNKESE